MGLSVTGGPLFGVSGCAHQRGRFTSITGSA
jgi:hypothetical protein